MQRKPIKKNEKDESVEIEEIDADPKDEFKTPLI